MKTRVIVVGLVEKDGKFLLGQKPENIGPYPNTWHIPGGGVDLEKESVEEALRREIQEEAGIEIDNIQQVDFDEDYEPNKHGEETHYIFLQFHATCSTDQIVAGDDMTSLEWIEKEKLKDLNLNKPSKKLLQKLNLL